MVVDSLGNRWKREFLAGTGEFLRLEYDLGEERILLVKPLTFMNLSGFAVEEVLRQFGAGAGDLLIVMDDAALPLGKLRIRPGGSDGGHNGLASVIGILQTDQIARLRCGIAPIEPVPGNELAEFVLAPFGKDEEEKVTGMVTRAADAVEVFVRNGITDAMSRYNT
jgi:PTH1 family peptidyl-tRNA hydrolase